MADIFQSDRTIAKQKLVDRYLKHEEFLCNKLVELERTNTQIEGQFRNKQLSKNDYEGALYRINADRDRIQKTLDFVKVMIRELGIVEYNE